ncbi:ubiquinone biosynthesis O-methyltransferase, mitochondrial isoform X1 [Denticeps clupeoides]|uniref:Ubiquinone biosynthesis O-methyltransferase, mitochondrial n=1 Tax=Denticeps clupeoides TaxID=299321 RepID=A0AAY4AHA0_9TELE|nr:ubiquinone biosynthesis O-methyltransferase, mitochondrial isoform X1 [Denticeps clupeoides]
MYCKNAGRLLHGLRCPGGAGSANLCSWAVRQQTRGAQDLQITPGTRCQNQSVRFASHSTLDPGEMKKFQSLASQWWDLQGAFAALHSMNDLRVPFVRDNLLNVHGRRQWGGPLAGLRILDVGCGGGVLTEPLGRMGADVLGVDPVGDSVRTAELHASIDPALRQRVAYRSCTAEELSEGEAPGAFDAVVASEVVEHLADLDTFANCCCHLLKLIPTENPVVVPLCEMAPICLTQIVPRPSAQPGGSLFITTINKTNLSYVLGIVAAERVLRIVPRGTHDWDKFVSPVELERLLEATGFYVETVRGMLYNPLSGAWSWTQSTAINYALHAVKRKEDPQPHRASVEDQAEAMSQAGHA